MNKPLISLIWAMDRNRLIGCNNALPWKFPADMAWFRKSTMGKPVLMGRKTFDSIGRPLPGRINLVLTRQKNLQIEGCTTISDLDELTTLSNDSKEIMVMGGAEIYALLLDQADRLYITEIDGEFEGDAWFPEFDRSGWQKIFQETHQPDEKNPYPYSFTILERC